LMITQENYLDLVQFLLAYQFDGSTSSFKNLLPELLTFIGQNRIDILT